MNTRDNKPVLSVRDLRTYFHTRQGTAKAVDGVSFSIHPGETYALVGESGCGKSVTALSILRLISRPIGEIAGGEVALEDTVISGLPDAAMREIRGNRISMIFQEPMLALNPVLTIGRQVAEVFRVHQGKTRSEARRLAVSMLGSVGIPDPEHRCKQYPHEMSGGMQQRVMIAMALAPRPAVLIADEPTTALDVTVQGQILELMRTLQRDMGTAILLITHDMGVVCENAGRVGVMYAGRIVEEAPGDAIFRDPMHPYTQLLLASLPSRGERDKLLRTIDGNVPRATDFPPGCRFNNRCPMASGRCRREAPVLLACDGQEHTAACFELDRAAKGSLRSHPAMDANTGAKTEARPCLAIRDLRMYFPAKRVRPGQAKAFVRAVDGVSLDLGRGETLALVGESGCGKTTLGNCVVRLVDPTGGSIMFRGRELAAMPSRSMRDMRRHVQMIFQDPSASLNPRLTIGEAIMEGLKIHGIAGGRSGRMARAASLMSRVGLDPGMLNRYPHEFSGGQRQRIGIARALAVDPELIICDEATSSLDVSVQAQILNLLRSLQAELDLSYLFITHDLGVVEYLADRVAVMYLGRIVEEGEREEIFGAPKHPYTRSLLAAAPRVDEETGRERIVLEGDVPSPMNPPAGCHFHPRCPDAGPECAQRYPEPVSFSTTHTCRCTLWK